MILFKVLNQDMAGKGKPIVSLKVFLPTLIINIVLNILWIPKYGQNGAAISSSISYVVASLFFFRAYLKYTGIKFNECFRYSKKDFDFILLRIRRSSKTDEPNK